MLLKYGSKSSRGSNKGPPELRKEKSKPNKLDNQYYTNEAFIQAGQKGWYKLGMAQENNHRSKERTTNNHADNGKRTVDRSRTEVNNNHDQNYDHKEDYNLPLTGLKMETKRQ